LDKLGYAPHWAYLEAYKAWDKDCLRLLSNHAVLREPEDRVRVGIYPFTQEVFERPDILRNMPVSTAVARLVPFMFDKKGSNPKVCEYCKTVPQIASVHFARSSTLPFCPEYYACLFSSPYKGYELDGKSFVDAVLSKQANNMHEESDGLPSIEDFEEDVLYFALCSGNVEAVQEALRRTDIEEVPLRWLAHTGSNRAIDVCFAALPVSLDGCCKVDGKRSGNASRLLHLLSTNKVRRTERDLESLKTVLNGDVASLNATRSFSKEELRPYFTEQACLEVNGNMPAMDMAHNDRKALLYLINGKMHHNLFIHYFWHWSDDVVFEAWKAVGAHKQDLVKILQDGYVEVAKKMLMHTEEVAEQEAQKHISILFGYGFVSEKAIESAICRRAWQDVYQLHSFGQRPRKSGLLRCPAPIVEKELKRPVQEGEKRIRLDWNSLFESPNAEALTVVLDTYTARANTRKFMQPEARQKLLDLGYFDLAHRVEKQVQKRRSRR
jgi:hypothetical protein